MKKIGLYFLVFILSIVVLLLGFDYQINKQPNIYYKVYLDEEYIGIIESKKELENYINNQADVIRNNIKKYSLIVDSIDTLDKFSDGTGLYNNLDKAKYILTNKESLNLSDSDIESLNFYINENLSIYSASEIEEMRQYISENEIYDYVDNIYIPNGIEIKKVYTYYSNTMSVPAIYKKIISKKSCTIAGYKFTIKSDSQDDIEIYTIDTDTFSDAIENLITIFVDENLYNKYKSNSQDDIQTMGSILENIYVQEDITYKAVNISVEEKIYTDATDLSAYLLYGDNFSEKIVQVQPGDSIESISFDNQISVQEFLIFNKKYKSRDNLLVSGTDVVISKVDPKIQIVVESYEVVDKETNFSVIEQYDESMSQGSVIVTQEGQNGIERVTQNVKSVNGEITYVDPVDKETIKSSVSKIISIGTKYIPNVGSTTSWGWPTNSGYTFSSYYGYRLSVFGEGNFHSGLDIAGTGYGSPVYAANNGVIETMKDLGNTSYGKHIIINHNNGYYTLYAHMSGFAPGISVGSTVSRGQIIGYIGTSGWATGPHLHYEIRTCAKYSCITNPLNYY